MNAEVMAPSLNNMYLSSLIMKIRSLNNNAIVVFYFPSQTARENFGRLPMLERCYRIPNHWKFLHLGDVLNRVT